MIKNMNDTKTNAILTVADLMAAAALTAPKASGNDTIRTAIITGEEKDHLRDKMLAMGEATGQLLYTRDAGNVDLSEAVVLIGCSGKLFGMDGCGMCGFGNCKRLKDAGGRCVFTVTDLGIAVGSAVSVAADHRIDNRVMYSVGRAALKLGFMTDDTELCYGIPLSISSKSIFFDRGPGAVIDLDTLDD
ncbi:MAG: ferredoxin [Firmicutes bacterium]|nr:ferredoxin [Bacillota bacterium]